MNQSQINKIAWNYRAYEFWYKRNGIPQDVAKKMKENPHKWIHPFSNYFRDVKKKKILIPLGSNGRKAIPLALMGADVTIIDISEENKKYAMELAQYAGIKIDYIISDFNTYKNSDFVESFDIIFAEGGILHYFNRLDLFFNKIYSFLKTTGYFILNDFPPIRKYTKIDEHDNVYLEGNYFESDLHEDNVAYQDQFPEEERKKFPKCLLRYWNYSDIITSIGRSGFYIKSFNETEHWKNKNLPGNFTLKAFKLPKSILESFI